MSGPHNPEHAEARILGMLWVLGADHVPRLAKSFDEWVECMGAGPRIVDFDDLGDREVSTVFLGTPHNLLGIGVPILFETCIFLKNGEVVIPMRYRTWEQAEKGHQEVLQLVKDGRL